jgi:hypothetical protein
MAAPEVADRHDQTRATVAVAKIELARIRPSAAVPSFGCAQNQRRSSRTISSSARAIATVVFPRKESGQPLLPATPIQIPENVQLLNL